ncbi:MAG: hypothetical protein EAZ70_04975 [Runella slithyformis]|nr:MAG: hypothetical protein EAY79_04370 [Runella slithyformis]TAF28590.1 MAG: hypothetical protein EAZ70_04975 [Runella slithyformis]TAF47617.1 MAG: hypothetical protein EAZ63_07365 [Runella slithyformis]TAH14808.1 MAG: hypothetical protein EAZ14_03035 [Runella slithyformis]
MLVIICNYEQVSVIVRLSIYYYQIALYYKSKIIASQRRTAYCGPHLKNLFANLRNSSPQLGKSEYLETMQSVCLNK